MVTNTLVPKYAPNVVYRATAELAKTTEVYASNFLMVRSIKFKKNSPLTTLPSKGISGSAAYDLWSIEPKTITPHSHELVSTGLAGKLLPTLYGQITSKSDQD